MDFSFTAAQQALRAEVKAFIAEHADPDDLDVSDGTIHSPKMHQAMADNGWLSGAVPPELADEAGASDDGAAMTPLDMAIIIEELQLAGVPFDATAVTICVASIILELGNDFLKEHVAGPMLRGEALGSFGYTEPESGSDVAAAQTKAVRDGDEWVINGQKMWTTMAHEADFVILLTRSNPDVRKHKGLTFFIVPLDSPGVEIQPVWTMGTERSNATFYDDVRLDDQWRLGEVDGGWAVMKSALKFERGIAGGQYPSAPLIDAIVEYATATQDLGGKRLIDDPVLRERIVRAKIDLEVCRCFGYNTAYLATQGSWFGVEGSMTKLFSSEAYKRHAGWFLDAMGPEGLRRDGFIEENWRHAPVTTIYGGTSEITRNLVAEGHLGLPRAR